MDSVVRNILCFTFTLFSTIQQIESLCNPYQIANINMTEPSAESIHREERFQPGQG